MMDNAILAKKREKTRVGAWYSPGTLPDGTEDPTMYWEMTKKYIVKYRNGDV